MISLSHAPGTSGPAPAAEDSSEDKIRIDDLSFVYSRAGRRDVEALQHIDLTVRRGEFVSVLGPSGCGKSTLLRILAGLQDPTAGSASIRHDDRGRMMVAPVFQEYSIFPWRSVEANVRLGLDARGERGPQARERVREWLEIVNLGGFASALPSGLSGGMKQRVALARAFVMEPEVLLMDEPFAALDAQLRKVLQDELLSICRERDYTVFFVTHNIDEAILLSDRIALMSARPGRIKQIFDVPFGDDRSPDLRRDPEFVALDERIWNAMRDDVAMPQEVPA